RERERERERGGGERGREGRSERGRGMEPGRRESDTVTRPLNCGRVKTLDRPLTTTRHPTSTTPITEEPAIVAKTIRYYLHRCTRVLASATITSEECKEQILHDTQPIWVLK
ncbi:hypothetical protein J6590_043899, partial [Homalodisca vitripennis]